MNIPTKLFCFLLITLSTLNTSCREEEFESEGTIQERRIEANSNVASLLIKTTMKDGSIDNIIDQANCFTVELPVSLIVNNNEITIEEPKDYATIEEFFEVHDDDEDTLEIIFPVTIILANYSKRSINNASQLKEASEDCAGENEEDEDIECLDILYPITLSTIINEAPGVVIFQTDEELFKFINRINESDIVTIDFPVNLIFADGSETSVNNLVEIEESINSQMDSCDEDDDYDFNDDDCNDCEAEELKLLLASCTEWKVQKFKKESNLNEEYNNLSFDFQADGVLNVTSPTDTYPPGTWEVAGSGNNIKVNINIDNLDDLSLEWYLNKITENPDVNLVTLRLDKDNELVFQDYCDDGGQVSVNDFTVNEDAGTANFIVTYTGSTLTDAFTVDFVVEDVSATNPEDYSVVTEGTSVSFPAGTTDGATEVVTINIMDDSLIEKTEELKITLSNLSTSLINIAEGEGTGTITDNDNGQISVNDFTVNEDAGTADFIVTYTGSTITDAFTVDFVVEDVSATNPEDYSVATAGTSVSFPAGTSNGDTEVVTINIIDDSLIEKTEELKITLSNLSTSLINIVEGEGTGTITDNDNGQISVNDFTVNEDAGTADFTVTYTGSTITEAFTVDFIVEDVSATNPDDYSVVTEGAFLSFPAGITDGATELVIINIIDDSLFEEKTEELKITLSNLSTSLINIADGEGTGRITDNDSSDCNSDDCVKLKDLLISCAKWQVNQFRRDGDNLKSDYDHLSIDFVGNGNLIVKDNEGGVTNNGIWSVIDKEGDTFLTMEITITPMMEDLILSWPLMDNGILDTPGVKKVTLDFDTANRLVLQTNCD